MLIMAAGLAVWGGCTPAATTTPGPSSLAPAPSTVTATGAVPTFSSAPPVTAGPSSPVPVPTVEPSLPYATAGASSTPGDSLHQITGIRVGAHDTYDRLVVDFSGTTGRPWWRASYVPQFATQGEGRTVPMTGTGKLQLVVGVTMPAASDTVVRGDQNLRTGSITGVYVDPFFEGQAQVLIGLDSVRGFRVFPLDGPTRIVVDIQR